MRRIQAWWDDPRAAERDGLILLMLICGGLGCVLGIAFARLALHWGWMEPLQ